MTLIAILQFNQYQHIFAVAGWNNPYMHIYIYALWNELYKLLRPMDLVHEMIYYLKILFESIDYYSISNLWAC